MSTEHESYEEIARRRRDSDDYRAGYAEAQRAFAIGQTVRERAVPDRAPSAGRDDPTSSLPA